jgi:hypothetical protein
MSNGMAKNLEVIKDQWDDYKTEVKNVIIPGIKEAAWLRKPHKLSAFGEEWFDKMPRLNWYLTFVGICVLIGWLV